MKLSRLLFLSLGLLTIIFVAANLWGDLDIQFAVRNPQLVWELRGSRALLAVGVGASLALAGALLQVLFSNPICEPYTLGISSGAALGAVIAGSMGAQWVLQGVAIGSLFGAMLFTLPLAVLASRGSTSGQSLLLAGVMMGFFGSSMVALVMALDTSSGVAQALVWLLGDLSRATSVSACLTLGCSLLVAVWIYRRRLELDALLLGERSARSVGVEMDRLKREVLAASSILVAIGVASSGMIGFVGLMIPHLVRRQVGSIHARVIPLCVVWGGISVLLSDLVARSLFSPREIPVGVITALIGAPMYFFWLRRGGAHG
ncbi:MAG: iron ABC transporter permease [Bdellovibrionales bacterium]|nr:iron ABC transporter permease [Bdellovibrionales bacterium]